MIRQQSSEGVELNVTAMLDMAFQLLAFFILTFRPGPSNRPCNFTFRRPDRWPYGAKSRARTD